ncbi:TonB-dependent receptor [Janthinobacterium sp.]|uniref:TonB-dependent receptor n=1 Tax=Janthinobacterium sp. TaxID=1871054 RepID=UPI00293D25F2|nr:TonB-dependent receptor [Janthinobacterium sp.]
MSHRHLRHSRLLLGAALFGALADASADGSSPPISVVISASRTSQIGIADSANAGVVTGQQLEARTVYRPGELLEATPGLIVSQHSGEGKANQFYLRGFNLDHGTDLRTSVDGMLVNQRSHAHGQGWTDLNFLIPELADRLEYRKGPYYAEEGDFAAAGAVSVRYADKLAAGIASVGLGQNGFRRSLLADAPQLGRGHLLYALELFHNDGPFLRGDDFRKVNGVLRYSEGGAARGFNVTAMAYQSSWNASDQIPLRGLASGAVAGRFDTVDKSDGGGAHRYSLSGEWRGDDAAGASKVNAYIIGNQLDLYSNFSYFLDDPLNGDQFSQPDRRVTTGVNATRTWPASVFGRAAENRVGLQFQNDNIHNGLYSTVARRRVATTRADHIVETSLGLFFDNSTRWSDSVRSVAGVRVDQYRFDVASDLDANSGRASERKFSPKLSLIFGPWRRTEFYVNAGAGFHSNDARGSTIALDPKSGAAADKVTPLVRSEGMEVGVRSEWIKGLQSSFSLYRLDFDSELLFVGDAGSTEAGRPSRRTGFEFSNYYKPNNWLTVDADVAFARARFRDADAAGQRIPGAVEGVASLALAVDNVGAYFGALQLRYFGPRPLLEDDSVRSKATATLNGRIGYKINRRMKIELEGFNLTQRRDSAIDYYYTSRLPGEPAQGVADVHFHPIESRSFRLTLSSTF